MSSLKVIQIVGNPHTGSTIIAMLLGSSKHIFSAGELKNITMQDRNREFCSCGNRIKDCDFWNSIFSNFFIAGNTDWEELKKLYLRFEKVRSIPYLLINRLIPTVSFKRYLKLNELLYMEISRATRHSIIVDSSKMPQRAIMLECMSNLTTIHLIRPFSETLNSSKRIRIKDLDKGVEKTKEIEHSALILAKWIWTNLLCETLGLFRVNSYKIHFNEFRKNPCCLTEILDLDIDLDVKGFIDAEHLIAGNRIRMQKNIVLKSSPKKQLENLSKTEIFCSKCIDKIFFFWSKN